jgi:DNA-binding response OmpR family regulator
MSRILVVDDDPDILESLELALGRRYDVVTATDGREALSRIASEGSAIDLVVLDLMMPRMSGDELVSELRARALAVPIIIASAASDVRHRAAELAAQDFVAKPFSLRQLREKIATVLRSASGSAPSSAP